MVLRKEMARKIWMPLLGLFFGLGASPQVWGQAQGKFGNEWINYAQTYYKVQVAQTGIYRLSREYLSQAGISGVDPRQFQLFRRGQEVAIHVAGEADGILDAGDYIEFYGERNDGKLDTELYKDPSHQAHSFYSLYTDTAAYFLTWSPTNGKRMQELVSNPAGLSPEPRVFVSQLDVRASGWIYGRFFGDSRMPWMDIGEGFHVNTNAPTPYTFANVVFPENTGGKPVVEALVAGSLPGAHEMTVTVLQPAGGERQLHRFTYQDYQHRKLRLPLEHSDIGPDGRVNLRFSNNGDWYSLRYIRLTYPQNPVLDGKSLIFATDSTKAGPSYLLFESPPAGAVGYDITNPQTVVRVGGALVENNKVGFVFPAANGKERLGMVAGTAQMLVPLPATRAKFRQIQPANHTYVIVSHRKLLGSTANSANPVRDYALYRASPAGGGHDTLVMLVDQLYDQFHYGEKSASGITRFMDFLLATGKPQYLLLLGKGLENQYRLGYYRTRPFDSMEQDLVPTAGNPGSDIMFTADWKKDSFTPRVATGRVSARTPLEVIHYLEKVKQHESLPHDLGWRKNVLHLGGGKTELEINQFKNYLNGYKIRAETPLFGGKVQSIYRNNVREIVSNINVSREVNNGLSLITFFGHSSTTVSDIDIGNASQTINGYRNNGKYPMILMNGCNSGNTFSNYSFGEDWIMAQGKGAILFMAHVHLGYPNLLNLYSSSFYQLAFSNPQYYGQPVAKIQQRVNEELAKVTKSASANAMAMQMLLQGDPAVALFSPAKPDYHLTDQALALSAPDQRPLTVSSDKFTLAVDVQNFGKATYDSIYVSVKHLLPDNTEILTDSLRFPPVFNRDTLYITIDSPGAATLGINRFEVFLDHTQEIDELNESNNVARLEYFFGASGLTPIYPPEYSIINSNKVKLTGMVADFTGQEVEYLFELDTTHTFRQPLKTQVVKAGMVPVWEYDRAQLQAQQDSTVYFWRVRKRVPVVDADTVWASSSFRYIRNGASGWSQSHPGQLDKAILKNLQPGLTAGTWAYMPTKKSIEIRGAGGNVNFSYPPYGIFVEGSVLFNNSCGYGSPNLLVAVFHARTLELYNQMPANTGSLCGEAPQAFYHFGNLGEVQNQGKLEAFLKAIPEGFHVAMVSMNRVPFNSFSPSLKEAFRQMGSSLIGTLQEGQPFALIGSKGAAPGTANELTSTPDDPTEAASQTVLLYADIQGRGSRGTVRSTRIGPATEWQTLFHQVNLKGADSYRLHVIGIQADGSEAVLHQDVKSSAFDLSQIDPLVYTSLQLELETEDAADRTPPRLDQWLVTYKGLPEGVVRPDLAGLDSYNLTNKPIGKTITFPFIFENISTYDMKVPVTAEVTFYKSDGSQMVKQILLRPLPAGDSLRFNYTFSADGLKGENRIRVFFNPRLQPELNYLNNIFEFTFSLPEDGLHPVLDVVFDGLHIMNGEIVSPSPLITMSLKDENSSRPLEDANAIEIYLKKPGAEDFEVIDAATHATEIQYTAGTDILPFKMDYRPKSLADGLYELRVQGKDVAGNLSGKEMYSVNFQVINESSITNFYPYPNPFSTSTRFIFTLTGGVVPENLKIQIMTITGKVIREITRDEIGPIRIGNNTTEFAWEGTDEFGDKLANGVYLYRLVLDRKADEFLHRRSAGDKGFKEQYGKVYILR